MRAALPAAVAIALAAFKAGAQAPEPFSEAVIGLQVNSDPATVTLVVRFDSDGALLLRESDLPRLRLRIPAKGGISVDGVRFYRYGPESGARLTLDPATQSAQLMLPAAAFDATERSARRARPPKPTVSPGAFVNYELYAQGGGDSSQGSLLEFGAFAPTGVLTTSMAVRRDPGRSEALRLETTFTRDFPEQMLTLQIGDSISSPGAWGRAVRYAGVKFGTNFATQPTLVTTPFVTASGEATVPSTADVFVNGRQVSSEQLPPGPFTLEGIPALNGAGEVQVVVTDALGRQQVIAQPYYTGPALLRAGLREYSVDVGAIRKDYGQLGNAYGSLVGSGTYRRGLSDGLTAELHAEGQQDGPIAVGLDSALRLGWFGVATLTAAVGGEDGEHGWLAGLGFERSAQRVSVFLRTQYASESFAQLGSSAETLRFRQNVFGGLGFNLARLGSLQLAYAMRSYWAAPQSESFGASYSLSLGEYGFLSISANQQRGEDSDTDVLLYWTTPLGGRRTAGAGLRYSPDREDEERVEAVATLQQSAPAGTGLGYRASLSSSQDAQLGASYRGRAGQAEVEYAHRNESDGWRASALGGLAITAAGVMPTRWLDRSFAVVEVAGYEGLTVFADNQPIGRTDSRGRVLLDNLRPYEPNPISIDPLELPIEAGIDRARIELTPAYRSGAVVEFPVSRESATTFRLRLPDGTAVPPGAVVEISDRNWPVALDGLVYTEGAATTGGIARWRGGQCRFELRATAATDPIRDLGLVTCLPEPGP
jgi:outer membrane usher protein